MIPEAWENNHLICPNLRAFYEFHSCLMEPWDGPAFVVFTDGKKCGAILDRNGLRPGRLLVSKNGRVILTSETGVLDIPHNEIQRKWRLQPGKMFLIDCEQNKLIEDVNLKRNVSYRNPYADWLRNK